jgi:oligopeptide transport system substrate-binding protein
MRGTARARWVVGAAVLALAATACGGGDDGGDEGGGEAATGGTFSMYIGEPEHLIPGNTNESEGSQVLSALYTGLYDYNVETSEPEAEMAESVESDDQTNWTVTIKEGWTFHDGTPVTAQSFVDAWNWTAYSPNAAGNSYFFANIVGYDDLQAEEGGTPAAQEMSGLVVEDDQTFTVQLNAPFSQFPLTLGYTAFYPMAEACLSDIAACEESPIGNGAYQMDGSWEHNQAINLTRYEDYAGTPGNADNVEFRIYSDINTAYNDLLAGNLDVMEQVPPERIAGLETDFPDRTITRPSSTFTYIGFPLYDQRFTNPQLRQAFSQAIDRQAIIDAIFNGTRVAAQSVVSPVVAGSRDDACGELCEYDPAAAKQKFDAAGGFQGTLNLWFNSGAGHDQWMQAVANQLRQNLGIQDIVFEQKDFAEYNGILDEHQVTGPYRLGWVMDYPSPQNYLEPIYATGASSNHMTYSNPEFDQLVAEGNAAPSIDEGIELYHQAEDILLQDMPVIPMWFARVDGAYAENVSDVTIDAFSQVDIAGVTVNS